MGNLAKILIKPTLILNERELADIRLLENTKITLSTLNQVDNISISKTYEDIKFSDSEEYELEFQVPNNIYKISVTVESTVNVKIKISFFRWCLEERKRNSASLRLSK
jgi:hypothetical protein